MDRNQATGLILIALMVIGYFTFFAPEPSAEELVEETTIEQEVKVETNDTPNEELTQLPDSLLKAMNTDKFGVFSVGASGVEETISLENDLLKIELSTKGASIEQVELKSFETFEGKPVVLLSPESSDFEISLKSNNRIIDLTELFYSYSKTSVADTSIHSFKLEIGDGKYVEHIYKMSAQGYEVAYQLKLKGLEGIINREDLDFRWNDHIIPQEKDITLSRTNTTINYYTSKGDFDYLSERSNGLEEEILNEPVEWISIKQRFFIAGFIAENKFNGARISTDFNPNNETEVKYAKVDLKLPYDDIVSNQGHFKYYFGPNDYHITPDVATDFSKNLWLGWPPMLWVNKFVIIPMFDLLNNFIDNYGIIIIIMVFLIKLALSPLSYKSYVSMAKMKVLKPDLDEIKEKHGDDMTKAQQEQMKLYQKVGVNPVSGCIPMVLQMPILLSMFYFFPQSIELRGKSFLWAENLSSYDSILDLPFTIPFYGSHVSLFVLLMTVSTIFITWQNQQVSTVQGPMKSFSYLMPVIFMFVLNSYPAALSFYYFVSNLVTFGQQALIRKFIDEDKIKKVLEENRKRSGSKKKSKFQQRLEDAMKASQQSKSKK
ncbi:membrane protein insertase YidC [Fulvivirga sp. M361]|uniref:membrane protein insertase YidC n=1 Tax=Fulvivirga sp. M361 TaxID=2594266 RepID=UPI00117BDDF2|nr:membrane protein insertase YidC [Fulvivirga sp. M361]TRX62075.1 membrane protein insertase YidC [Fulvivirga sp. M361]